MRKRLKRTTDSFTATLALWRLHVPTYVYRCEEHGLFDTVCPYALRDEAKPCPSCGLGPLWPRTWKKII
jgi:hypothetical protein